MGFWQDVQVTFATMVATIGVTYQVADKPPVAQTSPTQGELDKQILETINQAVEATETALKAAAAYQPTAELVPLALRDGLGVTKVVMLEKSQIPRILKVAGDCGRLPTVMSAIGVAGQAGHMIEIALKFTDPDVFRGIETLAGAIGDRGAAKRGESKSWNVNAQRQLDRIQYE